MQVQKTFTRVVVFLKSGKEHTILLNTEQNTVNPQAQAFVNALGNLDAQNKNFVFDGKVLCLIRISEVASVQVTNVTATVEEDMQEKNSGTKASSRKKVSGEGHC